ncbi:MAG: hypothetical protein QOI10_1925 [Solirubrobacterales bacterium]|jgi:chromosome segregation ATPase|nr:hypothetical protein [Solirubrobacterales bacterium]
MASEADSPSSLSRELVALMRAVAESEQRRHEQLRAKLGELDAQIAEAERVQKLITGGAARREARLRALEDTVEAMAAERARMMRPRPLDLPDRSRFDPSVVEMRGREPSPRD